MPIMRSGWKTFSSCRIPPRGQGGAALEMRQARGHLCISEKPVLSSRIANVHLQLSVETRESESRLVGGRPANLPEHDDLRQVEFVKTLSWEPLGMHRGANRRLGGWGWGGATERTPILKADLVSEPPSHSEGNLEDRSTSSPQDHATLV